MRPNILMPIMTFMTRYYHSSKHICRISSVTHKIYKTIYPALFSLVVFFLTSCEEDPTKIGNGMLPGSDFVAISSIDTVRVWSYTQFNDSTRTDNPFVSFLGQIYDPYFGTTTAELVSQVRLSFEWDDKPFVIDSVKLFMSLLHVSGGTDAGCTLTLSEIADHIYNDSAYYSYTPVHTTGFSVSVDLPEMKADTINNISVKLPNEFGEYITRDTSKLFYSNSKPDFRSYFKGIYFHITSYSSPMLISFSPAAQSTSDGYYNFIALYMHDDDGTKEYYLILDATNPNARYNRFIHDFNSANPDKRIKHVNDGQKDSLSYLQYLNGVYTKITIPGLEKIKNNPDLSKIAINKAKLSIPVFFDGGLYKASKAPSSLRLRYSIKDGTRYDVPDYNIDASHTFFDGKLDSINNVYNFNLPNFVQGYLKDTNNQIKPELEIFQSTTGIKNLILKANNSKTPVKFEITYTKF
jgi:hypothetical protein